jgi:hypothetical protein
MAPIATRPPLSAAQGPEVGQGSLDLADRPPGRGHEAAGQAGGGDGAPAPFEQAHPGQPLEVAHRPVDGRRRDAGRPGSQHEVAVLHRRDQRRADA